MELIEERRRILLDAPHIETISTSAFKTDMVAPFKKLEARFEAEQSGSGDPSPDNVRPISGHTECVTEVCGKNIFDQSWFDTNVAATITYKTFDIPNGTYTMSTNLHRFPVGGVTCNVFVGAGTTLSPSSVNNGVSYETPRTITVADGKYTVAYRSKSGATATGNNPKDFNWQVEQGSTATDYEQYKGTTYTTALGRTVYGGTLDVVTGLLTVDRRYLTVSDFSSWGGDNVSAGGLHWVNVPKSYPEALAGSGNICSHAEYFEGGNGWLSSIPAYSTAGSFPARIYVQSNSLANFRAEYANLQAVYMLAEPQTYQLTPQQILTLKNNNTLMSEGTINEIKYWSH